MGFNIFANDKPAQPGVVPYSGGAFGNVPNGNQPRLLPSTPGNQYPNTNPAYAPTYPTIDQPLGTLPYQQQPGAGTKQTGDRAQEFRNSPPGGMPAAPGGLTTRPVKTISARYGGETMGPPAPPPGTYAPVQNQSKGGANYDPIYTPGGTPTFSEILLSAALGQNWGGWDQGQQSLVPQPGGVTPPQAARAPGTLPAKAASQPPSSTFKGASTGKQYNVGQTYQGTNGYQYTAQPDGTFKQTGKPAGGGAKAYDDRASSNNKGAGGYTSSGQSKTAPDGTSWAANW